MQEIQLSQPVGRLTHLDWLRIIVVGMLIPFHTAMTFAPYAWYIRNPQLNLATQALVQVLDKYHMELLFFIAGVATFFSFGTRGWKGYLPERLKRLVVPLVFGMLVVVPPCYYYSQIFFYPLFHLTYPTLWDWYTKYWLAKAITPFNIYFGGTTVNAGALWFLWYLVLYTFVLFPLLFLIFRKAQDRFIPRLAAFFEKPGMLFLPVIPIMLVNVFSQWKWIIGLHSYRIIGWTITSDFQVLYYVLFFIFGFFMYSHARFGKGIDKTGPFALPVAAATMTVFMLLVFPTWDKAPLSQFWYRLHGEPGTRGFIISQCLYALTTWSWILSILYLARKFLNKNNRFVSYGNEAVLPVYIVHSTFIAVFSYFIVKARMDVLPKYVIIVALTYICSLGILELIKLTNPTRFLFGMRLKRHATKQVEGAAYASK